MVERRWKEGTHRRDADATLEGNVNKELDSFLRHFAQVVEQQRSEVCVFKM
jgi:hypothetical protein